MASRDDPEIGFTGARFGGGGRRRGRRTAAPGESDGTASMPTVTAGPRTPPDPVGLTGARFGGPSRRRRVAARPAVAPVDRAPQNPPAAPAPEPAVPDPAAPAHSLVRPYVLTSGRTRSTVELAIEALVSVRPVAPDGPTPHPDVVELCRTPRSVAEIAALRGVPLGVARVLLGDLAAAGVVVVHRTVDADGPDLALMRRVLGGLRRL